MSDEMAVGDKASQEEHKVIGEETEAEGLDTAKPLELVTEVSAPNEEAISEPNEDQTEQPEPMEEIAESEEPVKEEPEVKEEIQEEQAPNMEQSNPEEEVVRGIKRRASAAFSDGGDEDFKGFDSNEKSDLADYSRIVEEERRVKRRTSISSDDGFKGFNLIEHNNLTGYCQVLERLEAEVSAAAKSYTPLRSVMASPALRASKRARQDTDGSRPSSALSSRSDGDGAMSTDASSSPAARGRRPTAEMSSPLLRVPLERGWRRELVYRAAGASADAAGRRNADIYYYTPAGKKLRSTREVSEQLSGTGLTLENFSFFKEPLGIDDPEKEIIRDAKVIRRVESPVPAAPASAPVVDGKRTPKPKPPKGASPEPATPKSPPAKIKVKSMGSRLSSNGTAAPKPVKKPPPAPAAPAPALTPAPPATPADNNNTAAWKKPKGPPPLQPRPHPPHPQHPHVPAAPHPQHPQHPPAEREQGAHHHQSQQPCSMSCGRGAVPSLACAACLCLYHPACAGYAAAAPDSFLCKNCRKPSASPPLEPPPLTQKPAALGAAAAAAARRPPAPAKVPKPNDKRVLLRMKVAGGGPDGERVWAVAKPGAAAAAGAAAGAGAAPACRPALPQSLAVLNGRRFIVVSRALHQ